VEHVDPAVPLDHAAGDQRERLAVPHVEVDLAGAGGLVVGHHHGVAAGAVGAGQRGADAARATGDEHDLVGHLPTVCRGAVRGEG
jgi:hypothetical protein